MVEINFKGDPATMDFSLIKLTGGANLIDNHDQAIYSLGSGELTKIITEAGEKLRRNLEATLKGMKPNQSVRVQILIHGQSGYQFIPPNYYGQPNVQDKLGFILGAGEQTGSVISATPKGEKPRKEEEIKVIIVDNADNPTQETLGSIKHATPKDDDDQGANVITQD